MPPWLHVELRGARLHLRPQLGRPGPQRRDLRLGVGDLGLELGLLGLGGRDPARDVGRLVARLVEALLGQGHRVAAGGVGAVGASAACATGPDSASAPSDGEEGGDASKHGVACRRKRAICLSARLRAPHLG